MRYLVIAVLVCLLAPSTYGQTATDTTAAKAKEEVKIDYPYKVSDYDLNYFPDITIGVGLNVATRPLNPAELLVSARAGYRFKDKGWVSAQFDFPALYRFDYQYEHLSWDEQLRTTNDFFIYSHCEIGVGYFLTDTTRKPHTIFQPEEDDSLGIPPFVDYSEPTRAVYAVRSGLTSYQGIINSAYLDAPELIDEDGVVIGTAGAGSVHTPTEDLFHTNTRNINVYLGLERRRITNFKRDRGDEVKHVKRTLKLYGDLFFSPIFQIDPMYVRNTETGIVSRHIVDHTNGGGFERDRIGVRGGTEYIVYFNDNSGFNFGLETGLRPGVKNLKPGDALLGGNMYLQGSITYLFGFGE